MEQRKRLKRLIHHYYRLSWGGPGTIAGHHTLGRHCTISFQRKNLLVNHKISRNRKSKPQYIIYFCLFYYIIHMLPFHVPMLLLVGWMFPIQLADDPLVQSFVTISFLPWLGWCAVLPIESEIYVSVRYIRRQRRSWKIQYYHRFNKSIYIIWHWFSTHCTHNPKNWTKLLT